jgi:hypothetical protein
VTPGRQVTNSAEDGEVSNLHHPLTLLITWVMRRADELRLGVFERKILRRIYGPICGKNILRSRYNDQLYHLYGETDLVTAIKKTR